MAHILLLLTWTLLQAVGGCDSADTCVAVRACDNAKNIRSLESTTDKKLTELQAALDSVVKQNTGLVCQGMISALLAQLTTLERRLNATENEMQEVKSNNAVGPKVGFSASLADKSAVLINSASQTLVFKKVFINDGNAYNTSTGVFSAPRRGAYHFTFVTQSAGTSGTGAQLMKNGQRQVSHWKSKGAQGQTSGAVILSLNAGDRVSVMTWGGEYHVSDDGHHFTTFSGFLLYPL